MHLKNVGEGIRTLEPNGLDLESSAFDRLATPTQIITEQIKTIYLILKIFGYNIYKRKNNKLLKK